MNRADKSEYLRKWKQLTDYYGYLCYYCRKEIATTIDHVVPYSFDQNNDIDNLVPACALCNCLASNLHFETVEQKRQYILNKRKSRQNKIVICTECLLPFAYREHSPSLFLCAECYDQEYDTDFSNHREWHKWIVLLMQAGIPAQAHRMMRRRLANARDQSRQVRLETLIDEYATYIESDEYFAELLIRT